MPRHARLLPGVWLPQLATVRCYHCNVNNTQETPLTVLIIRAHTREDGIAVKQQLEAAGWKNITYQGVPPAHAVFVSTCDEGLSTLEALQNAFENDWDIPRVA